MAATTALRKPQMTIPHGLRGLVLAASTAVAADHSLTTAIIVGSFGLAGVVIGPFVTDSLRARRERHRVDHRQEQLNENNHLIEHMLSEMEERDAKIAALEAELARRRRR